MKIVLVAEYPDRVALRVAGEDVTVSLAPGGVRVECDAPDVTRTRVVPWATVLAAPVAFGVLRNGWHVETCATESDAVDRVNEIRSHGDAASYFRISH